MRLIVFFDLPMVTKAEKRAYVQFRRFLLNDGYDMVQWSVYARLLNGTDAQEKHLKRLVDALPPAVLLVLNFRKNLAFLVGVGVF